MSYKNQYLMKKRRLEKISMTEGKCEICGNGGMHVHHKDFSMENHDLSNLIFVCGKCHKKLHGSKRQSKFRKMYGATLQEFANELGVSITSVKTLYFQGKLNKKTI